MWTLRRKAETMLARLICQLALRWPGEHSGARLLDRITTDIVARLACISDTERRVAYTVHIDVQFTRLLRLPPGFFLKRCLGLAPDASAVDDEFITAFARLLTDALLCSPRECRDADIAGIDAQHHARLGLAPGAFAARIATLMAQRPTA
jgi:hypothetical protein